jgi:hypothetical protein
MMKRLRVAFAALGLATAPRSAGWRGWRRLTRPLGLSAGPRMCRAPAQAR